MKGSQPGGRTQRLQGIAPGSRHLRGASYGHPIPSRVLGVTVRPATVLISGRLRPAIKVAFLAGPRYILTFAGSSARLKSIAQLRGHCPIRNKGLRSFFRTVAGACGPTVLHAYPAPPKDKTADSADLGTGERIRTESTAPRAASRWPSVSCTVRL